MIHAPAAYSFGRYDDPLDDVVIAPERAFYHKVTAAHEYLLLSSSPPGEVFRMCGLNENDLQQFYSAYPDYIKKFKAAYRAVFSFVLTPKKSASPLLTFAQLAQCRLSAEF